VAGPLATFSVFACAGALAFGVGASSSEGTAPTQPSREAAASKRPALAPALVPRGTAYPGGVLEWQFAAVHENKVPAWVRRAASRITIAVIDTGADLAAPTLAAKRPRVYSVLNNSHNVRDRSGHGTFVASLAGGAVQVNAGIVGFGGDAQLLIVQAGGPDGSFTDIDEAHAIAYAVRAGAKIINLSLAGDATSRVERRAIDRAAARGVLLVAAAGNDYRAGDHAEYPAALLQPVGSRGRGGRGLVVAASDATGSRATFSSTGSTISLAAPGEHVFGAVSAASSPAAFPRVALPGARRGLYGFASGTSFAAPQVSGAAALVWAANPSLSAREVAAILKRTASGRGKWTPELGYGVVNVGRAVQAALAVGRRLTAGVQRKH
jgi:subtilisin family serine protease